MESVPSLWAGLPLSTGIATLVCYAGVFGDVISIEEMAERLAVSDREDFLTTLNLLQSQRRIITRHGFAALPNLAERIDLKPAKIETARRLIDTRLEDLRKLGRSPLVKFVGVSGSLAANNPTTPTPQKRLDLDVFLITRNQCLWLYAIPRSLRSLFPQKKIEPELCVNLVMDASNLEIGHKNFFTATEARNLIPVSGPDTYREFLQANRWIDRYYPGFAGKARATSTQTPGALVNKSLYVTFLAMRSIKWGNLKPLRELSFTFEPSRELNHNRISCKHGGYQAHVYAKFTRLAAEWFPDLLESKFIEELFPDQLSVNTRSGTIDVFKLDPTTGPASLDFSAYE